MLPHDPTIKAMKKEIEGLRAEVEKLKQKIHDANLHEIRHRCGLEEEYSFPNRF